MGEELQGFLTQVNENEAFVEQHLSTDDLWLADARRFVEAELKGLEHVVEGCQGCRLIFSRSVRTWIGQSKRSCWRYAMRCKASLRR